MKILTPEERKALEKDAHRPTETEVELCNDAYSSERMRFIADSPFYGIILMNLKAFAAGPECPAASVNYKNVKLHAIEPGRLILPNGEPFEGLTFHRQKPMCRRTILAHELLHVVFEHLDIPPSFDKNLSNIAQDAVINRILASDTTFDIDALPEGCIKPIKDGSSWGGFTVGAGKDKKEYRIPDFGDLDWIPVYHHLLEDIQKQCSGSKEQQAEQLKQIAQALNGQNPMGGDVDYEDEGSTSPEFEQERMRMRATILNAFEQCKHAGNVPGEIQAMVEQLTKGRIRWRDRLRRLLRTEVDKSDFSWRANPRRAHLGRGGHPGFFPRVESETIGAVWLVLDTSGSMSDEDLRDGLSEFRALRQIVPFDLYFVSVDCAAYEVIHYTRHEEPDWDKIRTQGISGRGGTSFIPAFEKVEEYRKRGGTKPAMLCYFTDLYGSWPEQAPDYPVYWIVTESGWEKAEPWGTKIIMKDEII